jgi:phenylacetate-coenzyme A ligase PaaK-like adenylate-forming protein
MTAVADPGRVSSFVDALLSHDGWSRERLLSYQQERLRAVIAHAVSASPYYREALGSHAADGDVRLNAFPTLPKSTLMEQFDRIVTDPRLDLPLVEAHAAGPDPGALLLGEYHVFSTSGSTGLRGLFVQAAVESTPGSPASSAC